MTMPFGRHKGVAIEDLPDSYLTWLLEEVALRGRLKTAVEREWEDRQQRESPRSLAARSAFILRLHADELPLARRLNLLVDSVRGQFELLEAGR